MDKTDKKQKGAKQKAKDRSPRGRFSPAKRGMKGDRMGSLSPVSAAKCFDRTRAIDMSQLSDEYGTHDAIIANEAPHMPEAMAIFNMGFEKEELYKANVIKKGEWKGGRIRSAAAPIASKLMDNLHLTSDGLTSRRKIHVRAAGGSRPGSREGFQQRRGLGGIHIPQRVKGPIAKGYDGPETKAHLAGDALLPYASGGYETFDRKQVDDKWELSPRSKANLDQKIRSA